LNQQSKVWLILISLWIINGSSFLAIKVAIDTIPPLLSAGLRFSISGAILFAVYFFQIKHSQDKSNRNLQQHQHRQKYPLYHREHHNPIISPPIPQEHITKQQWKDSLVLGVTLVLGVQGLLTRKKIISLF
jgi:drug/metabolite transporter (DMT)-like permease